MCLKNSVSYSCLECLVHDSQVRQELLNLLSWKTGTTFNTFGYLVLESELVAQGKEVGEVILPLLLSLKPLLFR